MKTQEFPSQRTYNIVIFSAVVLLILLNIFQLNKTGSESKKKNAALTKNVELQEAILNAKSEVNKYKGLSSKMDAIVKQANIRFLAQEKKMNKLYSENVNLKNENELLTNEINNIKEQYLEAIDSLMVTDGLNQGLELTLNILEERIKKLDLQIGRASKISLNNIFATPMKEKDHGYSKKTAMAKRVKLVKVCFDMEVNKINNKVNYDIYLRILKPDGQVIFLPEENKMIKHPLIERKVNISQHEIIEYNNERTNYCIRWHVPETLNSGVYIIELFTLENMLGTTTFTIK